MANYVFERFTRVLWVPGEESIADISAPTLAELATGTDLACWLTKDGLSPGGQTNKVDSGSLCDNVDGQTIGSVGFDFNMTFKRDNNDDAAWALANWADLGFIVVRRGILHETAFAAGQEVEVWDAQMGDPVPANSAANTQQTFALGFAIERVDKKAIVAA
jgi:hypothetical protein